MTKKIFSYLVTLAVLGFVAVGINEAWTQDWTGLFVSTQAILISFLPYLLKRYFDIYTPFLFRVGIVFFMCCTVMLGEIADFYNMFWWWDLILHFVASVGITMILFIFLLIYFRHVELKAAALFATFLAVGSSIFVAVLWEIYEFLIDLIMETNTPMQPSNMDTMTDLIVAVAGAMLVGVFGYRYIKWRKLDPLSEVIHLGATRNIHHSNL